MVLVIRKINKAVVLVPPRAAGERGKNKYKGRNYTGRCHWCLAAEGTICRVVHIILYTYI